MLLLSKVIRCKGLTLRTVTSLARSSPKRLEYDVGLRHETKILLAQPRYHKLRVCEFRTSQSLRIPPIFGLLLRPVLRVGAFLLGRRIKKWWAKKSKAEQEEYKRWFRERRNVFLGSFGLFALVIALYYVTHVERDPLTGRSRFIVFTKEQQVELGKVLLEMQLAAFKSHLVEKNHPAYNRLIRVIVKLLEANDSIIPDDEKSWTLSVVDMPLKNAYTLPGRNIVIFTGMLNMVENDDQLAIVLSHEMAHALLKHPIEQFSNNLLLDLVMTIPIALLWAILPDLSAILVQMLLQGVINVFFELPYTRSLENEADEVGLKLAANACADVREAVVFWALMRTLSEVKSSETEIPPFLSTHPSHGDREKTLNDKMPKILELRSASRCPPLSRVDPRDKFYQRTKREHEIYFKQRGLA